MDEERIISDRALGKLGVFHGRVGLCEGLLVACQTQIHRLTDDVGGAARMRIDIEEALKYVSTLSAKGGHPVPADEDGSDARTEKFL